jgi:D-amino peptidase
LNGDIVGETKINALVAAHFGIPIVLVTGDQVTAREARQLSPDLHCVEVKRGISRYAAQSLHPEVARERIQEEARLALDTLGVVGAPSFTGDIELTITFLTADMAEMSAWLDRVELTGTDTRTVRFVSSQPLDVFRTFITMVMLTRALVE